MRLTKKFRNIYVYNFDKNCDFEERKERSIETHNKIVDRYGQLEDIEEELGIDLITFVKILKSTSKKNSIYYEWLNKEEGFVLGSNFYGAFYIDMKRKAFVEVENLKNKLYFKDYGKTWALTKEELL